MKKLLAILLAFTVFAVLAGCNAASGPESDDTTEIPSAIAPQAQTETTMTPTATITATPEPTPEPITYAWDGIELVLESISDDVEPRTDIDAPTGKYVVVTLTVSGGDLIVDHIIGVLNECFMLTSGGETYYAVTFSTEHIERVPEDHFLHSPGPLHIYFDLPVDADISDAIFVITEPS